VLTAEPYAIRPCHSLGMARPGRRAGGGPAGL